MTPLGSDAGSRPKGTVPPAQGETLGRRAGNPGGRSREMPADERPVPGRGMGAGRCPPFPGRWPGLTERPRWGRTPATVPMGRLAQRPRGRTRISIPRGHPPLLFKPPFFMGSGVGARHEDCPPGFLAPRVAKQVRRSAPPSSCLSHHPLSARRGECYNLSLFINGERRPFGSWLLWPNGDGDLPPSRGERRPPASTTTSASGIENGGPRPPREVGRATFIAAAFTRADSLSLL